MWGSVGSLEALATVGPEVTPAVLDCGPEESLGEVWVENEGRRMTRIWCLT